LFLQDDAFEGSIFPLEGSLALPLNVPLAARSSAKGDCCQVAHFATRFEGYAVGEARTEISSLENYPARW